jgi:lipid II:glycine glycyltransferase (peptidoglycan interpeptide bridge formation enzyme)
MSLEVHKVLDATTFNTFVANNNGSFLQNSHWGQWQEINGRKSLRYEVREHNPAANDPIFCIQLIKHPLPFGQYYLYCPYGPVVSVEFQNQSEKLNNALGALLNQLKMDFPDCLFVKLEPTISEFKIQSADWRTGFGIQTATRIQPGSTLLLDLSKTREQLLKEMHPKNRYNIHVAEKYGVAIKSSNDLAAPEVEDILELIHNTTNRQAYRGHPLSYYQKFCEFFNRPNPENSKTNFQVSWSAAFYQEKMQAGAIFVDFGQTRDFLFGGSSDLHREKKFWI